MVEHYIRDVGVLGSSGACLATTEEEAENRVFKSRHSDLKGGRYDKS